MVAFKYAVITTGLSACAGVVASVVHKRPNPKGYDLRPSASVITEMPKTTRFDAPSPTSLAPANNNLQRPLARNIYWSAGTTPGSRLSPRAFVMPRHANLVASATALAASGLSLVIDLVNSAIVLAFELGSSALSSASTWALSSSSSVAKPAVPSSNELAVPASPSDASATTLLETTVAYAMSIMASTAAYAKVAALASATSQVDAARSTAVALHLSALSSANALLVSALASASSLRSTALATASATTLDDATLSFHSAAALLNSALSAAAVLVPSAAATATSATFVFEKAPLLGHGHGHGRVASIEGAAHPSLLTSAVASVNHFVRPVLADVSAAIGWMRRRERATPVIAPTPTRAAIASNPVPT